MVNIPWPFGDAGLEGGGLNRNSRTNLHSPQPDVAETEKEGARSFASERTGSSLDLLSCSRLPPHSDWYVNSLMN